MNERLTPEQLTKIVGEAERLSQLRQQEVDRDQMQEILQELNLSPDLLDEAMVQVQRRDALAAQQRRNRNVMIGAIASLVLLVAGGGFWWQQNQQVLNRVVAQQDGVMLAPGNGGNVTTVSRPAEVMYRVILKDAPVGRKLELSCSWTALGDQVLKQNRYQTKAITSPVWETHCQAPIGPDAPLGTWTVRMFLGDRPLSDATFEVK
jgi:hypothetical protein